MSVAKADMSIPENEEIPVQSVQNRSHLWIWLAFFVIILLELIIIVIFLPKSAQIPPNTKATDDSNNVVPGPVPNFVIDDTDRKPGDLVEFQIEDPFNCMVTSEEPAEGGFMLRAKFSLKYEKEYAKKFPPLYDKVKNEIRASILTILRQSTIHDVKDPYCSTIRRKIAQKINEIFHEPIIKDVLVEDFSVTPM